MKLILVGAGMMFGMMLSAQNCLSVATPQSAGICNDQNIPCDQKNFNTDPDFTTALYDYKMYSLPAYAVSQKFGSVTGNSDDFDSLNVNLLVPVNSEIARPVIVYSPLSSFTNSNISSYLPQYLGNFFASRGYLFITFESRRFNINRVDIKPDSELTDYISNPYYTSDSNVINHFREVRDSSNGSYGFFNLISGLNLAEGNDQLMTDAYYEMMYKNMHDVKFLLSRLYDDRNLFNADMDNVFLIGGSAGAVQCMNAGFLDHPDVIDQEFVEEMMEYKGLNYPSPSRLKDDFTFENDIVNNVSVKGVVNLWGRLSSLGIIDGSDPAILSVHGTWDEIFPFQNQASSIFPEVIRGFGAEGIFVKGKTAGIESNIISICQGGHTLFPKIGINCSFPVAGEKVFFDSLMLKINQFIKGNYLGEEIQIVETMTHPVEFVEPQSFSLIPHVSSGVVDSNSFCPQSYPEEFNHKLYGVSTGFEEEVTEIGKPHLNFRLYSNASLCPAYVSFDLEASEFVVFQITDMSGKVIHRVQKLFASGTHVLPIDWGSHPNGMYQFSLFAGNRSASEQMIVIN
ncbi:MAG: hypothetical protein HKN22_04175 [Bacteroidia bacterium]|nr:hypothetical protein [Bacteroidia bacterium]